jgi:hypothetical protein
MDIGIKNRLVIDSIIVVNVDGYIVDGWVLDIYGKWT